MDIEQLRVTVAKVEQQAQEGLKKVDSVEALRALESGLLGKTGSLGSLLAKIKECPPQQRGEVGRTVNLAKGRLQKALAARKKLLKRLAQERKLEGA